MQQPHIIITTTYMKHYAAYLVFPFSNLLAFAQKILHTCLCVDKRNFKDNFYWFYSQLKLF